MLLKHVPKVRKGRGRHRTQKNRELKNDLLVKTFDISGAVDLRIRQNVSLTNLRGLYGIGMDLHRQYFFRGCKIMKNGTGRYDPMWAKILCCQLHEGRQRP